MNNPARNDQTPKGQDLYSAADDAADIAKAGIAALMIFLIFVVAAIGATVILSVACVSTPGGCKLPVSGSSHVVSRSYADAE